MKELMNRIRETVPLIHCITNYVTVNDCANVLLACGASPIMADDEAEVEDITSICSGLVLNIGTLNGRTIPAMFKAGIKAKELGHPVVLDPVGAGASGLRTRTALQLLETVQPDVVRCNISEFKMLMNSGNESRGVDASEIDRVTDENLLEISEMLADFSAEHKCITAVSGAIDLVAAPDGCRAAIRNGVPMMSKVTGSGCMLSAVTAAFASVGKDQFLESVTTAFCAMGIAGETAIESMPENGGNAALRARIIDSFYNADPMQWEKKAKYEMF